MLTAENPSTDLDSGRRRRRRQRRRRRRRPSVVGSSETTTDGSLCFTDDDDDDGHSFHSPLDSAGGGGSLDESRFSEEIEGDSNPRSHKESSLSNALLNEIDLESGELELKVHSATEQRNCRCRICHQRLVVGGGDRESGAAIELGCSCKGDLAAAHKQCAETWFKIRGNTTCEICGANAINVVGEQTNEANSATGSATAVAGPVIRVETRNFWHGRRVMNVLLACMVFAFVISWLFHFNVLS